MKKTFLISLVLVSLVIVSSATVAMAASATADVSGALVDNLAISVVKPLLLGTLELKSAAAVTGAYVVKGTTTDPVGSQLAEVKIDSAVGALLDIAIDLTAPLSAPDVVLLLDATLVTNLVAGASASLPLSLGTTYTDTVASVKGRMPSTSLTFKIGASITTHANQTPAAYTGSFDVAVVYQ